MPDQVNDAPRDSMTTPTRELAVVMPVYNEEARLRDVIRSWERELDALGIDFQLRIYDDGSSDGSPRLLDQLAAESGRIRVFHQTNRGHGPTLLRAYREAEAGWILQVDSDGEIPAAGFARFWESRHDFDLLVGRRESRPQNALRRLVTLGSRWTIRLTFGSRIQDVNCPYRLMRREWLIPIVSRLPYDTFAPNVILSGLASRDGARIFEVPVPFEPRSGQGSLAGWRLGASAVRAFLQTVKAAGRQREET